MAVFQFYIVTDGQIWLGFLEMIVFGGTVIVYNLHRLLNLPQRQSEQGSAMQNWMLRHRKALIVFNILLAIHVVLAIYLTNSSIQIALLILSLVAIFYAIPFLKWKNKKIRIRDFGLAKPFILGLSWAGVTVILPYFNSEQYLNINELILLFLERFFFISALCIPFDIRDLPYDKNNMLQNSIPTQFGIQKSIMLSKFLFLIFLGITFYHYAVLKDMHFFVLAAALSLAYIFFLLRKDLKKQDPYFFTFYLDGGIILQSLLFCLAAYLNYLLL